MAQHGAWWIHKQQENAPLYFQQNYLQLFVCLSIAAFSLCLTTAADKPCKAIGPWIYKSCIPPLPVSFADPWLTVGLSQRKAISLTAWLLFQSNADLLHTATSRTPTGLFTKSRLILSCLSPFCAHPWLRCDKKEEKIGIAFFPPPRKHWKLFLLPSVWQFGWRAHKNEKIQFKRQAGCLWLSEFAGENWVLSLRFIT